MNRLEALWAAAHAPAPVQDSGADLHPYLTLADTLQPEWRPCKGMFWGHFWAQPGCFECFVDRCNGWTARVRLQGPGGHLEWSKANLPSIESARAHAETALYHLLRLQDASLFWEARDPARLATDAEVTP